MFPLVLDSETVRSSAACDYLGKELQCSCGRTHSVGVKRVIIESGALDDLPSVIRELGHTSAFVVADTNTYAAAGSRVESLLRKAGLADGILIYRRQGDLVPDERAIGEFFVAVHRPDVIVAVGAGVINDLAKYVGSRLSIPVIIVATAPSMDGFASDSSALILDNLKTSVEVQTVEAIVADVDVLRAAPIEMIRAGMGDMFGKYTALKDWMLGHIVTGEYYCEGVAEMVAYSVEKCIRSTSGLASRDAEAIRNLMEGLVLSGIAMSFVGNSRPASGAEHHISHYWENAFLQFNRAAVLHGTKVGIGTVVVSRIGTALASRAVDFETARRDAVAFDAARWRSDVERLFGTAAPGIIRHSEEANRNSIDERLHRIDILEREWERIAQVLSTPPSAGQVESLMAAVGAPLRPMDIGVDNGMVEGGVMYAKEIRPRYTVLQLASDLGLLEEFARKAGSEK
jgi:glycerol-1-phosphate dehydrogenase [NAD(P)+]